MERNLEGAQAPQNTEDLKIHKCGYCGNEIYWDETPNPRCLVACEPYVNTLLDSLDATRAALAEIKRIASGYYGLEMVFAGNALGDLKKINLIATKPEAE